MATEAQKRASAKYDANNTTSVYIKLNLNTEPDIIEKLKSVENKSGYIKQLIRNDIEKSKNEARGSWIGPGEKGEFTCSLCGGKTSRKVFMCPCCQSIMSTKS